VSAQERFGYHPFPPLRSDWSAFQQTYKVTTQAAWRSAIEIASGKAFCRASTCVDAATATAYAVARREASSQARFQPHA
jgi:hypothetical protein